ncbi:MAG: methyltransferase domain-containing protein [Deltaproteobacteria bacterium]|nr:methyltransferase domain-containing protein [Deltaproteobacteria bacterium]
MLEAQGPNAQQISYWNEVSGPKWVRLDETINKLIAPLGSQALGRAAAQPGERVLDIGCGGGRTTLDLASSVGSQGEVVGLDISTPLLDAAEARRARLNVSNVEFINADAQIHKFSGASFDLIFSRFGVMFFAEPEEAFRNLHAALRPGGRVAFACWQKMELNPWMTLAVAAVAQHVELPAPSPPGTPGPFSLADSERTVGILERAGFVDVRCEPFEAQVDIAVGTTLDETIGFVSQMGPAGALLKDASPELRQAAEQSIREALFPHEKDGRIELGAAIWIVEADVRP